MGMNILKINGTALAGIYVDASESFNKPERSAEVFSIPGRSGDLIIDNGTFSNVLITYPAYIHDNFASTWATLVNTLGPLAGYQRIECDADSTHFRLGRVIIPQTPEVTRVNKDGHFDLAFDCKPQRYLISGETVVTKTASGSISNPTAYASQPLLRIYGNGTITVNGVGITLTNNSSNYTDVDCEMMDCYYGSTSRNQYVSFSTNSFPTLKPGSNTITFGTGISKIEITPRWWEL